MKKQILKLSAILLSLSLMTGCVEKGDKYQKLIQKVDSLAAVNKSIQTEFDNSLSQIEMIGEGLDQLKINQNIISTQIDQEGPSKGDRYSRIQNDLQSVESTIENYKKQIEQLERSNSAKSSNLSRMISSLKKKVAEQEVTIGKLKQEIEKRDVVIAKQGEKITSLGKEINSLKTQNQEKQQVIDQQVEKMNEVFILVADSKTLKDESVTEKSGLFRSKKLTGLQLNHLFQKRDKRDLNIIEIKGRRPKVLSTHNVNSYYIEEINRDIHRLHIKDSGAFWNTSDYLIIEIH